MALLEYGRRTTIRRAVVFCANLGNPWRIFGGFTAAAGTADKVPLLNGSLGWATRGWATRGINARSQRFRPVNIGYDAATVPMEISKATTKAGLSHERTSCGLRSRRPSSAPPLKRSNASSSRRSLSAGGGPCCDRLLSTPSRYSTRGASRRSALAAVPTSWCSYLSQVLVADAFTSFAASQHFCCQQGLGAIQARGNRSFGTLQNGGGVLIALFLQAA